ncbi:MAG: NAD(P)H-dependent oxidoreductase [Phycisphaerales bacterium]
MSAPKILAFAGSLRAASFNKMLVRVAAEGARGAGGDVQYIDLRDYPMPMFDEDLEAKHGMDPTARKFKELMIGADGILLASPEYNGSVSAVLKNAIDWASRPEMGEAPLIAFKDKPIQLMSASPGGLGGIRGLIHLRALLGGIQMMVMPQQHCVMQSHKVFDEAGHMNDEKQREAVLGLGKKLVETVNKLRK